MSCLPVRSLSLLATVLILFCRNAPAQPSSIADFIFPVADGPVLALLETNGVLYVGGAFTQIGPHNGAFAPVSATTAKPASPTPYFGGTVSCSLSDGQGGAYVGGTFVTLGAVVTTNLAHLRADQTLDPAFTFSTDAAVSALTIYSNLLFVGGSFTLLNGQSRSNLAAVEVNSGQIGSLALSIDGGIQALAISASVLYLGGGFTNINGTVRNYLAAYDLPQGTLNGWNPSPDSSFNFGINTLIAADSRIYAAGDFSNIGGSPRNQIAAFDATTGALLSWDAQVTVPFTVQTVQAVAVSSNAVYIGGNFTGLGGQPRSQIGAVDKITGSALPWNPVIPYNTVRSLAVSGNTVYVGGDFPSIATNGPQRLAALDATTGAPLAWTPAPGGTVLTILPSGNWVYAGGSFDSIGGVNREVLAAIDLSTGLPLDWDAKINADGSTGDFVFSLAASADALFIGGWFNGIDGQPRGSLGAVKLSDGGVLPFDPSPVGQTLGLCLAGTNLIAKSSFPSQGPLVFETSLGQLVTWDFGVDPTSISSFAASSNTLYVCGNFTQVAGQPRSGLAAFDINTHQLLPWSPTLDGAVAQILVRDQSLIAYGSFQTANGQSRSNLATFDAVSGDLALGPTLFASDGGLHSMSVSENSLGLAGNFTQVNQLARSYFAEIDLLTSQTRSWDSGITAMSPGWITSGYQTASTPDWLVIAGPFTAIGGVPRFGLAAYPVTNRPPQVEIITPTNNTILHAPAQIPLTIQATRGSTSLARIDVYSRTDLFLSSTNPLVTTNWTVPKHVGDYLVTAVAYDQYGEEGFSPAARITVVPPVGYIAPSIAISFPQSNKVYAPFSTITVQTDITNPKSSVERVQFFIGTNLIATITNSPYSLALTNLAPGAYSVTAVVQDEFGITASSGATPFRINNPPQVRLQAPANGIVVAATNLQFLATASDSDGSVQNVSYYAGGTFIGSATNSPFNVIWSNPPAGYYNFTAVATDDFGSMSTSAVAKITIYPAVQSDQVVDNNSLGASFVGAWSTGTVASIHFGTDYRFANCSGGSPTATATYVPSIPTSGLYDVFIWYPQQGNASTNSQWTISYNGGQENITVDQAHNASQWRLLASGLSFQAGTNGYIAVSNQGGQTDEVVAADAVRVVSSTVPFILLQPNSQVVRIGGLATFNVSATGSPVLSYQWKFNGADLAGATTNILRIGPVQFTNGGIYSVTISNALTSVTSSNAILTVPPPSSPTLSLSPTSTPGQYSFSLVGDPGVEFAIESSTNLIDWSPSQLIPAGSRFGFFSDVVTNGNKRFLRAHWLP